MQLEKSILGASKEMVMFYFLTMHKIHRRYSSQHYNYSSMYDQLTLFKQLINTDQSTEQM